MAFLTDLDEVLRERGVKVQTHPGWKTRGYLGMSFTQVRGTLWHHTATHRSAFENNPAPTVPLCRDGRSDLPGPLCQIVLARDGVAHIIAAGWGNHAGYGSYPGIPTDQGNAYLIGVEMESSGIPPYDWTLAQLQAIPVLRDALRDGYGHKLDIGHMEWSSQGKIDPAGLPGGMNWLRTATARTIATASSIKPTPIETDWFDTLDEKTLTKILDTRIDAGIQRLLNYDNTTRSDRTLYALLIDGGLNATDAKKLIQAVRKDVADIKAQNAGLTAAVTALAEAKGIDPAAITNTVETSVRDALAGLSITLTTEDTPAPNEKAEA